MIFLGFWGELKRRKTAVNQGNFTLIGNFISPLKECLDFFYYTILLSIFEF